MTVRELEDKINPKEEITKSDIDNLLNPSPVSATMPQNNSLNINPTSNPNNDFNTSVGIDYSTPPKFIDYDVPNINDNLESTANKSIDINAIKDNAKDINLNEPVDDTISNPTNNLFNVPKIEEKKEEACSS